MIAEVTKMRINTLLMLLKMLTKDNMMRKPVPEVIVKELGPEALKTK